MTLFGNVPDDPIKCHPKMDTNARPPRNQAETIVLSILKYNKIVEIIVEVDTISLSGPIHQIAPPEGINT